MSDLIKRMNATLAMGVIAPRSSAHEYAIAESQFREAKGALKAKDKRIAELEAERDRQYDQNCSFVAQIAALENDNERLRAALETYADAKNWSMIGNTLNKGIGPGIAISALRAAAKEE